MEIQIHRIYDGNQELEDMSNDKVQITMSYEDYHKLKMYLATADAEKCLKFDRMLEKADINSTYEFIEM